MRPDEEAGGGGVADLRMPFLGLVAWVGALLGQVVPGLAALLGGVQPAAAVGTLAAVLLGGLVAGVVAGRLRRRRPRSGSGVGTLVAVVLVLGAAVATTVVREHQLRHNPVTELAGQRASVTVRGTVRSDPRTLHGRFGDQVLLRVEVREVVGRGSARQLATPVLVFADPSWRAVALGSTVRVSGRLGPSDGGDLAGLLHARGDPAVTEPPDVWWRAASAVRESLRAAVAGRPADQRALVPALVDGDDAGLDDDLAADFRSTGLTHLVAVSGTNLTLLVGFLLVVARWGGVRGRWLSLVGAGGIVGFVLLARTEPSVLRAAAMGTVGLLAMGTHGRERGFRGLGVAVLVLVLVDPMLATTVGFALSVLATAGILVLAPPWRDALARWLPGWIAAAIAVPAAAQLACTPLIAAISGQVSVVAVAANLLVAPAVGPATVLGLAGGLAGLLLGPLGRLLGTAAGWCVAWIILVARRGADLPTAAVGWGTTPGSLALLTLLCVVVALGAPRLLRRRSTGLACCLVLVASALVRLPTPGWPPAGWALVACDVGQGDALVLRAGPHSGVVVDAGPDPAAVDRCLDDLAVDRVPLLVLTHFHADHVDGLEGVLQGRTVAAIETTRLLDPPAGVSSVNRAARSAGLVPHPAAYGSTRRYGDVTLQVLWPEPDSPVRGPGDGSTANEASVVLLARVRGVRMLLTGDVEPEGQAVLARSLPGLHVAVLKVPHHGSRYQDEDWLRSLRPTVALTSVGADNDYGHPAATTLDPLAEDGVEVLRTDEDGDLAVVVRDGQVGARTRD